MHANSYRAVALVVAEGGASSPDVDPLRRCLAIEPARPSPVTSSGQSAGQFMTVCARGGESAASVLHEDNAVVVGSDATTDDRRRGHEAVTTAGDAPALDQ